MKSPTIKFWKQIKQNPSEDYRSFFEAEKEFLKKNLRKDQEILEIGCGTGETIEFLSPLVKEITGIDNDKYAIEKCKKKIKELENAKVILADAENIPSKENSFDAIICMGATLGNFGKTKNKILKEIKKILKEKGQFIFSIYNEDALEKRLKHYNKISKDFIVQRGKVIFKEEFVSEQFYEKEILQKGSFSVSKLIKGNIFYIIEAKKS
jgi:ubiquinone/menaquinone biosynthesis C-methylase UbiE